MIKMLRFYSVNLRKTISWCRLLIFITSTACTQTLKSGICSPSQTTELPKIYPVPPLQSEGSELPEEIINATSQNPDSGLSWSKLIYQSCKVSVEFICNATYPIEWVEHYDQKIDQLMSTSNNIAKNLWTDRIINSAQLEQSNSNGTSSPISTPSINAYYTSFLGLNYKVNSFCIAANYTCRSAHDACLQSTVVSIVDKERETIRYEQSKHQYAHGGRGNENDTCEATLEVSLVKDDHWRVGWKCKSPHGKSQNLLLPHSRTCDAAMHCNSYFTQYKKNCVKRLANAAKHCHGCWYKNISTGYLRHAGFVWCENEDHEILAVAHYFFSVPQTIGDSLHAELYLHWDEADPQKMLYLEPLPTNVYVGETKHIICKVSRYYFSYGHRFGFEYQNGTIRYTDTIDGTHELSQNVNKMNVTMSFIDQTLARIYCFAPVWNSTVWINQSIDVKLKAEGALGPSFFVNDENLQPADIEEKVTFDLYQRNATLSCKVYGEPAPKITWIIDASDNETEQVEIDQRRKNLVFHYVKPSTHGKYTCEASNFLGPVSKVFSVSVRDKHADFVEITSILGTIFVFIFIVLLGISWMKVRLQRNQLRALTDAEIMEFRKGNVEILENQEYLDTQELLQALPYNDEYEIPSESLYIDASDVLGSGHFGQVLKGVISDSHARGKCNVVAVKTTKPKQNVTYFQTLLTEVKIMAYIGQHINVVNLVGACTKNIKNRQIYIAVEYCSNGSLDIFLKRNRSSFVNMVRDDNIYITTSFSDPVNIHTYENFHDVQDTPLSISTIHLIKWSREIANGMEFLGSKKIVHGDLAARNILVTDSLIAKIGDFGLSRVLMRYSNYIRSSQDDDCLLPWAWLAPETLQELKFSAMSDVWSFGVTIWEIFSLAQHPYPGATYNTAFIEWLKQGHRLHKPLCANSQIYNFMMDCWTLEPSQRMTFTELKDSFEGLLLQCSGDYVYTKSNGATQYINGSHNLRVQNPGYAVIGSGNVYMKNGVGSTDSDIQTFSTWIPDSSEDRLGYLKPLMLGFENHMQEEVI